MGRGAGAVTTGASGEVGSVAAYADAHARALADAIEAGMDEPTARFVADSAAATAVRRVIGLRVPPTDLP